MVIECITSSLFSCFGDVKSRLAYNHASQLCILFHFKSLYFIHLFDLTFTNSKRNLFYSMHFVINFTTLAYHHHEELKFFIPKF